MTKQFTLKKHERLKSRKAIDRLFKEGNRFGAGPFRIVYWLAPAGSETETLQFGVTVSTRNFKKATDRNRVKRLTREAYRLQKHELKESLSKTNTQLQLFLIYIAADMPRYELVYEKTGSIIKRLKRLIDESITSHT